MSASARIELDRLPNVIVVPSSAVFLRDGATVVYVVRGGSAEARAVTVARRSKDRVALSGGLDPGERVALSDPLVEGRP
jgi:multidrug efflux pump subunit AcrA (membrane-fusion protein)